MLFCFINVDRNFTITSITLYEHLKLELWSDSLNKYLLLIQIYNIKHWRWIQIINTSITVTYLFNDELHLSIQQSEFPVSMVDRLMRVYIWTRLHSYLNYLNIHEDNITEDYTKYYYYQTLLSNLNCIKIWFRKWFYL